MKRVVRAMFEDKIDEFDLRPHLTLSSFALPNFWLEESALMTALTAKTIGVECRRSSTADFICIKINLRETNL